jgi:hypothetical protein
VRCTSLLLVGVLSACAASHDAVDASVDSSPDARSPELDLYDEVQAAICARVVQCARPEWLDGLGLQSVPNNCDPIDPYEHHARILAGDAHVDADAARACIAALEETDGCVIRAPFDTSDYVFREPREARAWEGLLGACATYYTLDPARCGDEVCAPDDDCRMDVSGARHCVGAGADCSLASDCVTWNLGDECVFDTCGHALDVGGACEARGSEDNCALGAYCGADAVCGARGEVGEPCDPVVGDASCRLELACEPTTATCVHGRVWPRCNFACDPGEYCVEGTCAPEPLGAICSLFAIATDGALTPLGWFDSCPDGYVCDAGPDDWTGRCRRPAAAGSSCAADQPCVDGAMCRHGICETLTRSSGHCARDADCPDGWTCNDASFCAP